MTPLRTPRPVGLGAVGLAGVLWGLIGLFTPALLELGLAPTEIAFWRAGLGGAAFLVHAGLQRRLLVRAGRDAVGLALFGAVAVGLFYVALTAAIEHGGVSLAWILLYTAPAWVALAAVTVLGERVDGVRRLLVAATVVGVALVAVGGGDGVTITGRSVVWGLVAGWSYASWYVGGKRFLDRYPPVTISAWTLVSGAVVLLPFVRLQALPARAWLLLAGLGLVSTYLPVLAYYSGLARVDASRAAIVATIEPVVAIALGVVVSGERLAPTALVGGGVVLLAASAASARR